MLQREPGGTVTAGGREPAVLIMGGPRVGRFFTVIGVEFQLAQAGEPTPTPVVLHLVAEVDLVLVGVALVVAEREVDASRQCWTISRRRA